MEFKVRKQNRLQGYDYSSNGAYFLTLCTLNREHILSRITVGDGVLDVPRVQLSELGLAVNNRISEINRIYNHLNIDKYVIMPNHIHMIVLIHGSKGTSRTPSPTDSEISKLVSTLKRFVHKDCGAIVFQRSFHDHIIRDENDFLTRWQYIDDNPARWSDDPYFTK